MDPLTQILNLAHLKSSVYCRSELGSPWGLHFAPRSCAVFHVLHRGTGFFRLEGQTEWSPLQQGDLLLLPNGQEHTIVETPTTQPLRNLELDQWGECALMRWSETPSAVLLCGTFNFEFLNATSLFQYLPSVIHIPYSTESPLNRILELMADEAEAQRPAKEVVLRRLADILFVQIIQRWVQIQGKPDRGWLSAFHDPFIGKALELIHSQPQQNWTVASLARSVACSRSAFAARFSALIGEPPLEYLTRWRMQIASRLLTEDPTLRIGEIAARVGYRSEAAFSKAFKRLLGAAPSAYRSTAEQTTD
ncbi:MAG: AraC family transcriptional regulator [Anaerolineae bacterium]|nr:MAG: AraC family transcriptional regulator [Anaerolineae bacterium]